jgi:hypothetical protein
MDAGLRACNRRTSKHRPDLKGGGTAPMMGAGGDAEVIIFDLA